MAVAPTSGRSYPQSQRFLVTADDQFGHGSRFDVPGARLAEQAANWQRRVDLARELNVDAILYLGDAFEDRENSNDREDAFQAPLRGRDVGVIAIVGNHDGNEPGRKTTLDNIADAGLISLHRQPGIEFVGSTAVVLMPWMSMHQLAARESGWRDRDHLKALATKLILRAAAGIHANIVGSSAWRDGTITSTVLGLHFDIGGAVSQNGTPIDVAQFADGPVLPLDELQDLGYDAVLAGHIHRPQVLSTDPLILYPGSPMCLNFGEGGFDHGAYLVDVQPGAARAYFLPLPSRRFVTIDVDLYGEEVPAPDATKGLSYFALDYERTRRDVSDAIIKIRYRASAEQARHVDQHEVRRLLVEAGAYRVHTVGPSQIVDGDRPDVEQLQDGLSDLDLLRSYLEASGRNGDSAELVELAADYLREMRG
jgi:exonuclease SbcD